MVLESTHDKRRLPISRRILYPDTRPLTREGDLSVKFGELVLSITHKNPVTISQNPEPREIFFDDKDADVMAYINDATNPEELTEIIFNRPPGFYAAKTEGSQDTLSWLQPPKKIVITAAKSKDSILSEIPIAVPKKYVQEYEINFFNKIISSTKNFLRASKIDDGFKETYQGVEQRGLWVIGVLQTLDSLTHHKSNTKGFDWGTYFNGIWNSNRYTTNKRGAVITALLSGESIMFNLPDRELFAKAAADFKSAQEVFDTGAIDEATDAMAIICRSLLEHFSSAS